MSKSQIRLRKPKCSTPGTESNYEEFFENLKGKLIRHIEENRTRYFDYEQIRFDQDRQHDEILDSYFFEREIRLNKNRKRVKPLSPKETEKQKELSAMLEEDGIDKNDFNTYFSQYLKQILQTICDSKHIETLLGNYNEFIKCRGGITEPYLSLLISGELHDIIQRESTSSFKNTYKYKWFPSLKSINASLKWLNFIDNQSLLFSDQKSVFQYYWNIYKSFRKWNLTEPAPYTAIENELKKKCIQHRIKLRVDKTEKEMIDHVRKWSMIKISTKESPIFSVDSLQNFVSDAFDCHDNPHSIRTFNYKLDIPVGAHFILLIRHLYETDLFNITKTTEHKGENDYKKIEFQLWLEFTFRDYEGFSENNIERYFTDAEDNMKGRNIFNEIRENFALKTLR